ncbi:hypothetical protein ABI59_04680 [Acidobacteria bacterium Mor1]|nr:hypothetical protein ABI59_04680 [Acidobacteria bacterium Mor1]
MNQTSEPEFGDRIGVVVSIQAELAEDALARIAAAPSGCGLVELRADRMQPKELSAVLDACSRPLLVTLRLPADGGGYDGSPARRRKMLEAALAGGAMIDVEHGSDCADLAAAHPERVVLSDHGSACRADALEPLLDAMAPSGAWLKIVPVAETTGELGALRDLLRRAGRQRLRLAAFAMGGPGALSRLLACAWGSWGTYAAERPDRLTAPGQFTAAEMLDEYRVGEIDPGDLIGIVGSAVRGSPSPAMHNAAYRALGRRPRYVPLEAPAWEELAGWIFDRSPESWSRFAGFAATMPFKEPMAGRCVELDRIAAAAGSVNTVRIDESGRALGFNTDGPAVVELLARHLDLAGARVAILGAGGTARAAASALAAAGARPTLYNRTEDRARSVAAELGVEAGGLDALRDAPWEGLVQATPLGKQGEMALDPELLRGRAVLDAVYGPSPTPLVLAAQERGLAAIDGFSLLVAQAVVQFEHHAGVRPDPEVMAEAGAAWLQSRSAGAS